jgi:tetratricopeptide (TPR) repeat protein/tRNA A-37 threonylcarbamoyl transferase component Bud32
MRVGAYTLDRVIGRGGMGEVWLARRSDGRYEGTCAIKFLEGSLGWSNRAERFRREGQVLARLTHPNIARLLDAGTGEDGVPYLALEYIDGARIDQYCDSQSLSITQRVRLFLDVIAAVAHAHNHLIVHRDIKPSNVLVTADGQVKLLDFGIAKLLSAEQPDDGGEQTRVEDAALTPEYAAPEQMLGELPSTATDVYQLGLLLYVLLAGRHPRQLSGTRAEKIRLALDGVIRPPSLVAEPAIGRQLRGDLDAIISRAVRAVPAERYATAQALQDDLQRYLAREPVHARRGAALYRLRKFVARNRVAAAASIAIVVSLSVGLFVANRERVRAEERFEQVRQLSNKLFDIDRAVRDVPGTTDARKLIVDTSLEYLGRLADDAEGDPDFGLDLGTAYMRVARVQGIPIATNLGQSDASDENLKIAASLVDDVLAAQPENRLAYLRRAQIAHDRMILAGLRRPDTGAMPLALESTGWLDKYLQSGSVEPAEAQNVAVTLINVGNRYRIEEQYDEALRLTRRAQEIASTSPDLASQQGGSLIGLGRIQEARGDFIGAIDSFRQAADIFDRADRERETKVNRRRYVLALIEQAETSDMEASYSLARTDEAVALFRRAFDASDELVHRDTSDADSRSLLWDSGHSAAALLRRSDPASALALEEHVLLHLAELPDNPEKKRNEADSLALAATMLGRLGRGAEARGKLEGARTRLAELGLYPTSEFDLTSEAAMYLMSLADWQVATGDIPSGLASCEELLRATAMDGIAPREVIEDAAEVSYIYATVSDIQRRAGMNEAAAELEARRLALWQHWALRRPDDPYVRARLAAPEPR